MGGCGLLSMNTKHSDVTVELRIIAQASSHSYDSGANQWQLNTRTAKNWKLCSHCLGFICEWLWLRVY